MPKWLSLQVCHIFIFKNKVWTSSCHQKSPQNMIILTKELSCLIGDNRSLTTDSSSIKYYKPLLLKMTYSWIISKSTNMFIFEKFLTLSFQKKDLFVFDEMKWIKTMLPNVKSWKNILIIIHEKEKKIKWKTLKCAIDLHIFGNIWLT